MKLWFAGAMLASPISMLIPQGSLPPSPLQFGQPQRSLLGNGGFQSWSFGTQFQGPIAPDLWYAMGSTANFFGQSDIAFTRVADACSTPSQWMAEIRANAPNNFISQSLEDFTGLDGQWVTFSVDVRSPFTDAHPRIAIDDGESSSSTTQAVNVGGVERLTVQHLVSSCATRLEFRIYPEQTVQVDNAMAVAGRLSEVRYVPRRNTEPGLMDLPIGAVVDWYRFDAGIPVPEGFAICDGSTISDGESALVGRTIPNLAGKFVRGETDPNQIGTAGGSSTHSHAGTTEVNHGGYGSPPGDYWWQNSNEANNLHCARDGHTHAFTTNAVSSLPPYIGLLKIIRIK